MEKMSSSGVVLCMFSAVILTAEAGGYSRGNKLHLQRPYVPLPFIYQRTSRPYAPYYPYASEPEVIDYYPQDPYDKYRIYQMPYSPEYYYDDDDNGEYEDGYGNNLEQNSNADANAMFLRNLIMSQMYSQGRYALNYPQDYDDSYIYGEPIREPAVEPTVDSDVKELKMLAGGNEKNRRSKVENRWIEKRTVPTVAPVKRNKGQDEVVMARPAPIRAPYQHQRSYKPTAYDAIKKLLIQQDNEDIKYPQKRSYVLNEDSLVQQLGDLKKTA